MNFNRQQNYFKGFPVIKRFCNKIFQNHQNVKNLKFDFNYQKYKITSKFRLKTAIKNSSVRVKMQFHVVGRCIHVISWIAQLKVAGQPKH